MTDKLKPCPFCGQNSAEMRNDKNYFTVWCRSCGAMRNELGYISKEAVTTRWNKRPIEDALRARLEAAEELIEAFMSIGVDMDEMINIRMRGVGEEIHKRITEPLAKWEALK